MPYNIAGAWPTFESYYQPPDPQVGPCRNCGHSMEDHDTDPWSFAGICDIDGCGCGDGAEVTLDDHLADEADRAYDEMKTGGL